MKVKLILWREMVNSLFRMAALVLICLGLLQIPVAVAEEVQLTGYDEAAMPEVEFPSAPVSEWKFLAGTGPVYLPVYEGASAYRVRAVPLFQAINGNFFVGTLGGVGYHLIKEPDRRFGVRLGAAPPRNENADSRLAGTGDIRASGEAGIFYKGKFNSLYVTAKAAGGSRGSHAEIGAGYEYRAGIKDFLRVGAVANWANAHYLQTYFGISAEQSVASGLPEHQVAGGLRNYGVVAGWSHVYNRNWLAALALSSRRLAAPLIASPLVQTEYAHAVSAVVIYLF